MSSTDYVPSTTFFWFDALCWHLSYCGGSTVLPMGIRLGVYSTVQGEDRVVFDLCGRPHLPFASESPEDMGVWALTLPRFSVILTDMPRHWKSLRLALYKAKFSRT